MLARSLYIVMIFFFHYFEFNSFYYCTVSIFYILKIISLSSKVTRDKTINTPVYVNIDIIVFLRTHITRFVNFKSQK